MVCLKPDDWAAARGHFPQGQSALDLLSSSEVKGGSETVLVVEDDMLVRNYVMTQVASLGYATLQAANATEALKIIDDGAHIDLLFGSAS